MNKHIHRLVFDRRRGMRVPAAEHHRSAGKAASGQTRGTAVAVAVSMLLGAGVVQAGTASASAKAGALSASGSAQRLSASASPARAFSASRSVADMVSQTLASGRPNLPVFSEAFRGDNRGEFDDPTLSPDGTVMTLLQKSGAIIVNWDSFNIGKGYTVEFTQPDGGRALNKVRGGDASLIDGVLKGNGEVMVENGAGIIFGRNARVNVGSLVATALSVAQAAIDDRDLKNDPNGENVDFNDPTTLNIYRLRKGEAVFGGADANTASFVATQPGAVIQAKAGGKVLMVAPRVLNQGVIETPEGQTVLAAGQTVYLFAPTDLAQRGLIVAVDNFSDETLQQIEAQVREENGLGAKDALPADFSALGTVENQRVDANYTSGLVRADKGTINLVGAAIRQKGQLTATTAVKGQNGAIFITAMKDTAVSSGNTHRTAKTMGTVELGVDSITEVLPSAAGLETVEGGQRVTDKVLGTVRGDEGVSDVVLTQIGVGPDEVLRAAVTPDEPRRPTVPAEDASDEVKAQYQADLAQFEQDKLAFDAAELTVQRSSDVFYRSRIDVLGSDIVLKSGARVQAPAGEINILAADNWQTSAFRTSEATSLVKDNSRVVMEAGAVVDVSGLNDLRIATPRRQLTVQLFSAELADSPVQRASVVYRQTVRADARTALNLGDVSGYYKNLRYTAAELSTTGGVVRMQAQGNLTLDAGSTVDFSGGRITYDESSLITSALYRRGLFSLVSSATRDQIYDAFVEDPGKLSDDEVARYGLSGLVKSSALTLPEQMVGKSAGAAVLAAPEQSIGARLDGSVSMSEVQRNATREAGRDPGLSGLLQVSDGSPPVWDGLDELVAGDRLVQLPKVLTGQAQADGRAEYLPHLFTSLRPTAGWLVLGREVGFETAQKAAGNVVDRVLISSLPGASYQSDGVTVLSAQQLNAAGLGGFTVFANHIQMGDLASSDAPVIKLAAGGHALLKAREGDVRLQGQILAPGGRIEVLAQGGDALLEAGARLDASGTRTDDRFAGSAQVPGAWQGGDVSIKAAGSVVLQQGSDIDVSGAAWRQRSGDLVNGGAGRVTLKANDGAAGAGSSMPDGTLVLAGTLSGHDMDQGGTLSLEGLPSVRLGEAAEASSTEFVLADGLYADRGFGNVKVASLGDITVAQATQHRPVLVNMLSLSSTYSAATGQTSSLTTLPQGRRSGVQLSLIASTEPNVTVQNGLPLGANLHVEQGALIDVGLGGSITLQAGGSIDMAGTLQALGGQVSLALLGARGASSASDAEAYGYLADQSIHLKAGSLIDVSGAVKAVRSPSALSRLLRLPDPLQGEVLAGGTITLGGAPDTSVRGTLLMDAGATLKLNGAQGQLRSGSTGRAVTRAAGAGTLNIRSTDGFSLLGTIEAKAPNNTVSGGTLNISLSQQGKGDFVVGGGQAYPDGDEAGPRSILIGEGATAVQDLSDKRLFGQGVMTASLVNGSGFDRVSLQADDSIQLHQGVNLKADDGRARLQSVVLDAPVLELVAPKKTKTDDNPDTGEAAPPVAAVARVPDHVIQAHHVAMGPVTRLTSDLSATPPASQRELTGDQWLHVQAGLIEVTGDTAVQGANRVDLDATLDRSTGTTSTRTNGEIRFIGQRPLRADLGGDRSLKGQFSFQGDLNLRAGVVYATTLSQYALQGTQGSRLTVSAPDAGSTSQTPLSALASLSLKADAVTLDGVLHQPVGSLSVQADTLTVTDRARLANTADGVTVPVGYVVNNSQWLYSSQGADKGDLPTDSNVVQDITQLPINQQIVLDGDVLSIGQTTVVEAQAGGDIVGWQFNPGVGGSTDTYLRPGLFAVLPSYRYDFAPYDANIRARTQGIGTDLKAGDQVVINSGNGVLAPGAYTLLDARYGILPGAVLLSPTTLNVNQALSTGVRNDDGSVVVSGFRNATGTFQNGGNDVRQAWVLEPEATYRAKSEVVVVSGNAFQDARARRSGAALPRPGDGGTLSLTSVNAYDWAARFNFMGAEGLRAGALDLAMPDIVVSRAAVSTPGQGVISAQALEATGAESILLGGVRTQQADGSVSVERLARAVRVAAEGTAAGEDTLTLPGELLMVAKEALTVEAGVSIAARASDDGEARRYDTQDDGAQLLVSHRKASDVASVDVEGKTRPVLMVGADGSASSEAVRLAGAAVQLDSTGVTTMADSTVLEARTLGVGAAAMVLGDADTSTLPADVLPADALRLSGEQLARLNQAERLTLRANAGSLAIAAGTQLGQTGTEQITLDASQLLGLPAQAQGAAQGDSEAGVTVAAQNITLRNSSGQSVSDAAASAGVGKIEFQATPVLTDGRTGGITVDASGDAGQHWGFAQTSLSSQGDIVFAGQGRTQAAGDVLLEAARVTAAGQADQTLVAKGGLRIAEASEARTLNESLGAGGRLALAGQSLTQAGRIDIEAGRLTLTATGQDLTLAEGSTTRVDGRLRQVSDTFTVASGGGQIVAQALQGNLVVNGLLSANAPTLGAGVDGQTPEAGRIELKATAQGAQVRLGEQARLDVSGGAGRHGEVVVDTATLALGAIDQAQAAQAAQASQQSAAANTALDHLVAISRPADGGSLRAFEVRQREGDLSLNAQLRAARAALSADQGNVLLNGSARIDATTEGGGVVQLQAGQNLVLNDGVLIEARSTREGANGGDVLLSAQEGSVQLGAATVVADSVDDALDGRILIRARQTQNAQGQYTGMKVEALEGGSGATLQAGRVQLEGVRVYDSASLKTLSTGAATASNLRLNDLTTAANAYATAKNEADVLSGAGLTGTPNASLRAGIEVQAQGDFTVSQDLQMAAALRPLNLTIRAAGNLNINGSVSAGFNNALTTGTVQAGEGASLRFVAGADLNAADVHATQGGPEAGHVTLASNKLVRTTTGSIDVHAAGDVRMMASSITTPSAMYVTGGVSSLADNELFAVENTVPAKNAARNAYETGANAAVFTERGERLTVKVGGRVGSFASVTTGADGQTTYKAQQLTQGSGNYFLHGGAPDAPVASFKTPVAWFTRFGDFRQGLGSFGGGNIHVQAGVSVSDLAVVAPTNGRQVLTLNAQGKVLSSQTKVLNGGDVSVVSGGDIAGGLYFLGRGTGRIQAAGGLVSGADGLADGATPPSNAVADPDALLAVMDGQWAVNTVGDLRISHAYNPTAIPFLSTSQGLNNSRAAVFFTYGDDAGVSLSSLQGQVSVSPNNQNFELMHSSTSPASKLSGPVAEDATFLASVLPPVFKAVSLGGDVLINTAGQWTTGAPTNGNNGSALFVMPTPASDVTVYAAQDLHLQGNLQLPDTSAWGKGLPGVSKPVNFEGIGSGALSLSGLADLLVSGFTSSGGNLSLSTNVRSNTGTEGAVVGAVHGDLGQATNANTVRLVAERDVAFDDVIASRNNQNLTVLSYLRTNRPTEIVAGRDINNPHFVGQNFDADDVTRLSAGRDINGIGVANNNNPRVIALSGPGALKIEAGRDLNLRQMAGVLAYGNRINTALPDAGAKITVSAGRGQAVNLDELLQRHGSRPGLRTAMVQALVDSGLPVTQGIGADDWAALSDQQLQQAFSGLKDERQVAAIEDFLNAEFAAQYLPEEAGQTAAYYRSEAFQRKKQEAMWARIRETAAAAGAIAVSTDEDEEARRKVRRVALFEQAEAVADLAGLGATFTRSGSVNVGQSRVHNLASGGGVVPGIADDAQGGVDVIAADQVLAGLPSAPNNPGGFINYDGGTFRSISGGDFLAGDQRVIAIGRGNLLIYSVNGSIDSGKGSNTVTSTALPLRRFNSLTGQVEELGQPPISGSGFQKIETPKDMVPVFGLYAPNGEIRALDAFIKGDAPPEIPGPVVGADNIDGVPDPSPPPNVSVSLTPQVANPAAGRDQVAAAAEAKAEQRANSVLTVDLLGYGDAPGAGAPALEAASANTPNSDEREKEAQR